MNDHGLQRTAEIIMKSACKICQLTLTLITVNSLLKRVLRIISGLAIYGFELDNSVLSTETQ